MIRSIGDNNEQMKEKKEIEILFHRKLPVISNLTMKRVLAEKKKKRRGSIVRW